MNSVPFVYVNFAALFCHVLLLFFIVKAKKAKELRYLVMILIAFIVQLCTVLYMRLIAPPSIIDFLGRLCLIALFTMPMFLYLFISSYVDDTNKKTKIAIIGVSIIIILLVSQGIFIEPPIITVLSDGSQLVTHKMNWLIIIPAGFHLIVIYLSAALLRKGVGKTGIQGASMGFVIIGITIEWSSDKLMTMPGNIFPWDALAAILFALLCALVIFQKRSLYIDSILLRSIVLISSWSTICFALAINFFSPAQELAAQFLPFRAEISQTAVVVLFAFVFGVIYMSILRVWDVIFNRDTQRRESVTQFSHYASQTLSTDKIASKLMQVLMHELPIQNVYILGKAKNRKFELEYSAIDVGNIAFSLREGGPIFKQFENGQSLFLLDDLRKTKQYDDLLRQEPMIFQQLHIGCIVAARSKDEINALILIPMKDTGKRFSPGELSFVDAVTSIASTAMHNAILYERVYMEARTDSLTGTYNYRYFLEKINTEFAACQESSIALLYLNIDDFSLFNNLYGYTEGDRILIMTARLVEDVTEGRFGIYCCSGTTFALLLAGCNVEQAYALAKKIQHGSAAINRELRQRNIKSMTLSGGISTGPHTAKNAQELIEQADLALFNANRSRKSKIMIFRPHIANDSQIMQRVDAILEQSSKAGEASYELYLKMILALAATIDAKDHYTYNHSQNVARYAGVLAAAIGLSDDHVRIVYEAALLHDIGKISIPESILSKTTGLSESEYAIMKEHVNNSIDIIRHLPSMDYLIPAAIGHHERWDGRGYPQGIAGEKIPILARCLAVADAFDAMTTNRSYRKKLPLEHALSQIEENAATQFDPQLAHIFVHLVRSGEIYIDPGEKKEPDVLGKNVDQVMYNNS